MVSPDSLSDIVEETQELTEVGPSHHGELPVHVLVFIEDLEDISQVHEGLVVAHYLTQFEPVQNLVDGVHCIFAAREHFVDGLLIHTSRCVSTFYLNPLYLLPQNCLQRTLDLILRDQSILILVYQVKLVDELVPKLLVICHFLSDYLQVLFSVQLLTV